MGSFYDTEDRFTFYNLLNETYFLKRFYLFIFRERKREEKERERNIDV